MEKETISTDQQNVAPKESIRMVEMYDTLSNHKYTSIFHEEQIENNAPHHFFIVDKASAVNRENFNPIILGSIDFQNGPILTSGVNGVMGENLIAICIKRLEYFQNSDFATKENAMALTKLQEAMMWLQKRTSDRELREVEGTHNI